MHHLDPHPPIGLHVARRTIAAWSMRSHCRDGTYVPGLAFTFSAHPVEIRGGACGARRFGQTKYSLYRLIRLNFDLMTGFSVAPLQFFSMAGGVIALSSLILVV